MPKCPNCGRETLRTEDWACQWCGHPLLSGSFKKIPKTYRELQEERSFEVSPVPEDEPEPAPVAEVEPLPRAPEPEPEAPPAPEPQPPSMPEPESEIAPEAPAPPEPVAEVETEVQAEGEIEPSPESEGEPVVEEESIAEAEPAAVAEIEVEAEPAPEPATEIEPEAEAVPATEPVAAAALEPDAATGILSTTVEGLNTSFNSDKAGTNNKLLNKVLQVTGAVEKVFAKDHLDIFYIILAGAGGPSTWQVRCTFSREHGIYLSRLTDGQTVTVQGTYVGYERNIILKECSLA